MLLRSLCTVVLLLAVSDASPAATVLITGANRGIGLALAREYAARDWKVIATARSPQSATELRELASSDPDVTIEPLDVTDHAAIDALAAKYRGQPLDALVNNAGIAGAMGSQVFGRMDYAAFRQTLEVNAIGALKLSEALLPNLLAGKNPRIVALSTSEASFANIDAARLYWYRASKAALNMLMLNLAYELKPKGVIVALLNPGPVDTDMMRGVRMPKQPPAEAAKKCATVMSGITLDRTGKFWNYDGGEVPW